MIQGRFETDRFGKPGNQTLPLSARPPRPQRWPSGAEWGWEKHVFFSLPLFYFILFFFLPLSFFLPFNRPVRECRHGKSVPALYRPPRSRVGCYTLKTRTDTKVKAETTGGLVLGSWGDVLAGCRWGRTAFDRGGLCRAAFVVLILPRVKCMRMYQVRARV